VRHSLLRDTGRRLIAGGALNALSPACGELFRAARAGRYFGGLWYKVFDERGPC
jgi:hypothetical protein